MSYTNKSSFARFPFAFNTEMLETTVVDTDIFMQTEAKFLG